ncbi:hypothetical protein M0811_07659 [Anaeramoeba ignava]|uniref:Uncharacterized protein n=1 Tax=Anaeramoeba ignava TaxID=1746090 RepID=A0A9Q0LNC9_ANAIG|nr:hypothetical protein M0811_07659 [Anaeramoeba ignava]
METITENKEMNFGQPNININTNTNINNINTNTNIDPTQKKEGNIRNNTYKEEIKEIKEKPPLLKENIPIVESEEFEILDDVEFSKFYPEDIFPELEFESDNSDSFLPQRMNFEQNSKTDDESPLGGMDESDDDDFYFKDGNDEYMIIDFFSFLKNYLLIFV